MALSLIREDFGGRESLAKSLADIANSAVFVPELCVPPRVPPWLRVPQLVLTSCHQGRVYRHLKPTLLDGRAKIFLLQLQQHCAARYHHRWV